MIIEPDDFARRSHLGPQADFDALHFCQRKHRYLDGIVRFFRTVDDRLTQFKSDRRFRRQVDQIYSRRFADERDRSRTARIDLEHKHFAVGDNELNVEQALDVERTRKCRRVVGDGFERGFVDRYGREHRNAVARMNSRAFDVLHDPAD